MRTLGGGTLRDDLGGGSATGVDPSIEWYSTLEVIEEDVASVLDPLLTVRVSILVSESIRVRPFALARDQLTLPLSTISLTVAGSEGES